MMELKSDSTQHGQGQSSSFILSQMTNHVVSDMQHEELIIALRLQSGRCKFLGKQNTSITTRTVLSDLRTLEIVFFLDFNGAFSGKDSRRFSHDPTRADTTSLLT